jgi:hypothetical protein
MDYAPPSSDDGLAPLRRLTGFALPGRASQAGRKGHDLGLTREWTAEEARQYAVEGGYARAAQSARDARGRFAR